MPALNRLFVSIWTTTFLLGICGVSVWAEPANSGSSVVRCENLPRQGREPNAPISNDDQIEYPFGGVTRFIMRRLPSPEGAIDFRILGEAGAPAILSLIGPTPERYADYTYNGFHADMDISHGGLNLRPLDGLGGVNVWSMAGNTRLRVGSKDFQQSIDFWHSGADGYISSTTGHVIVASTFETKSTNVLGGDTFINGILRTPLATPPSSSSECVRGQAMWDEDYIYVCTSSNTWKRTQLSAY